MITLQSYLRGEWVAGRGQLATLVNPTTGEPVAQAGTEGIDLKAALAFARSEGGPALRAMTFAERGKMLKALSAAIHDAREELIEASILNAGTTRGDAKFDIDGASGTLAYYAALGKKLGDAKAILPRSPSSSRAARASSARTSGCRARASPCTSTRSTSRPGAWPRRPRWRSSPACRSSASRPPRPRSRRPAGGEDGRGRRAPARGAAARVSARRGTCSSTSARRTCSPSPARRDTGTKLRGLPNILARSVRVNVEADSLNAAVLAPDADDETYADVRRATSPRRSPRRPARSAPPSGASSCPQDMIDRVEEDLSAAPRRREGRRSRAEGGPHGPARDGAAARDFRAGVAKLEASGARIVFGSATRCDPLGADAEKGFFVGPVLLRARRPGERGRRARARGVRARAPR